MWKVITFLADSRVCTWQFFATFVGTLHDWKNGASNNLEKRHLALTLTPFLCEIEQPLSFPVISLGDIIFHASRSPQRHYHSLHLQFPFVFCFDTLYFDSILRYIFFYIITDILDNNVSLGNVVWLHFYYLVIYWKKRSVSI